MIKIKEKYVKDSKGHPTQVVLDIKQYRKLLRQLEELESIRAYDAAKASDSNAITFDQAIKEIQRER